MKTDFADKYPNYEFIDCGVGEGDLAVAYVHVRFKRPGDDKIQEEVWQYWDTVCKLPQLSTAQKYNFLS